MLTNDDPSGKSTFVLLLFYSLSFHRVKGHLAGIFELYSTRRLDQHLRSILSLVSIWRSLKVLFRLHWRFLNKWFCSFSIPKFKIFYSQELRESTIFLINYRPLNDRDGLVEFYRGQADTFNTVTQRNRLSSYGKDTYIRKRLSIHTSTSDWKITWVFFNLGKSWFVNSWSYWKFTKIS